MKGYWIATYSEIKDSERMKKYADKAKEAVLKHSGKIHSFTGPIYDQKGNILVAEGKVADDGMLLGMNVYVKGVEGDIPK